MTIPDKVLHRQAALLVETVADVRRAVAAGHPADVTLSHLYRQHPEFGSRDRHLLSGTVFSVFRWLGWLTPERAPDEATTCVLAHLLDADALHPAVALLLPQTRLDATALRPLGGLDLKTRASALATLTGTPIPLPTDLIPAWALARIGIPPRRPAVAFRDRLTESLQTAPPTWLRLPVGMGAKALDALRAAGLAAIAHPQLPDAIRVDRGANLWGLPKEISRTLDIQDLASQAVGHVCAPNPRSRWWDVCAGSGGKALHLAMLMKNRGSILATDVRESILAQFERRKREAGLRLVELRRWDGLKEPAPEGAFDGILLDAPCSGLGTWHRNPDARWRTTDERVSELAGIQATLLAACAPRLTPGGALVYATCTLTEAENHGVLDAFLAAHPDFTPSPFPNPLNGVPCDGRLTIFPWEGPCNGMFIARLTRT